MAMGQLATLLILSPHLLKNLCLRLRGTEVGDAPAGGETSHPQHGSLEGVWTRETDRP